MRVLLLGRFAGSEWRQLLAARPVRAAVGSGRIQRADGGRAERSVREIKRQVRRVLVMLCVVVMIRHGHVDLIIQMQRL